MKIKLSGILQGEPLWPSYIIGQLTGSVESVQTIVLNGSVGQFLTWNQSHCARFSYTPKIPVFFNTNAKIAKMKIFGLTV